MKTKNQLRTPQALRKRRWSTNGYRRWLREIGTGWEEESPTGKHSGLGRECFSVAWALQIHVSHHHGRSFSHPSGYSGYILPNIDGESKSSVSRALRKLSAAGFVTVFRSCPLVEDFVAGLRGRLPSGQSVYVIHQREDAPAVR